MFSNFYVGQTFKNWTVIDNISIINKRGQKVIKCRCICGTVNYVYSYNLIHGRSSGCKKCNWNRLKISRCNGIGPMSGTFINEIISGARKRNHIYNLTNQDLLDQWNKQNGKCALSGIELTFNSNSKIHDGTASVDRIDSSKGYTKDNIQFVHKDINLMKQDCDEKYFIDMCRKVADFYDKTKTDK